MSPDSPGAARTRLLMEAAALAAPPPERSRAAATKPRVEAIVLTRDRPEYLPRALDSLDLQGLPIEILLVDQASAPAGAEVARAECAARPSARLDRIEYNLGPAAGRRRALGLGDSELVLFLDDDAELMPGALAHMLDVLDGDEQAYAVSATVVTPDGLVSHSGGSIELSEEVATFALIGCGEPFADAQLPPSGVADWVGGTAVLVRRVVFEEFPFDDEMGPYYEDNEWSYRISLAGPPRMRRSREALVLHHLAGSSDGRRELDNEGLVSLLCGCAHFYDRHGLLIGPWSWDLLPERAAPDGSLGLDDLRLVTELITAKGPGWTLAAWSNGDLDGLVLANRRRVELERTIGELDAARLEVPRLNQLVFEQQQTMSWLFEREATLREVEAGRWWRLRRLITPLSRTAGRLLGALRPRSR